MGRPAHRGDGRVPVTPLARTLDDLASVLPFIPLRRVVREAYNQRVITTAELARARSRVLRSIAADLVPTRNTFEDLVLDLIRTAGFEDPVVNVALRREGSPYEPDFRWPHRGLIVEADGAATHEHDLARHQDAQRQARLEAATGSPAARGCP